MSIKITEIAVKNCGPISEFKESFGSINLIYSKNERGKSFLVEFIIRCLFKNKNNWGYLRESGEGKVTIQGLDEKNIDFRPNRGVKLEDYLEKKQGLPLSLVKLMVVKEGETDIVDKNESGIDKNTIKNILSPRKLLDSILNKISKTVRKGEIINLGIDIANQGDGETYNKKREEFYRLNEIVDKLTKDYEQGIIHNITIQIEKLKEEKEILIKSKKYKGYKLSREIHNLEEELEKIPEFSIKELKELITEYKNKRNQIEDINREITRIRKQTEKLPDLEEKHKKLLQAKKYQGYLISEELKKREGEINKFPEEEIKKIEQGISNYQNKKNELKEKEKQINELKENSKGYEWLKAAKEEYTKISNTPVIPKQPLFLYITFILFLITGLVLISLNYRIYGIILIVLGTISEICYLHKIKKDIVSYKQADELISLKNDFKSRFGTSLNNLVQIETLLNEQQKAHNCLDILEGEQQRLKIEVNTLFNSIIDGFKRLKIESPLDETNWNNILSDIYTKRKKLEEECQKLQKKLDGLDIDESQYQIENPGIEFDKDEMEKIEKEIEKIKTLKEEEERKSGQYEDLKNQLSKNKEKINALFQNITGETIDEGYWEEKINEILDKRERHNNEINKKIGELKGLGVGENEYVEEDPGKEYSEEELKKVEKAIGEMENKRSEEEKKLNDLKYTICQYTGSDISCDWSVLIDNLFKKREEIKNAFQEIEAKILSGIIVNKTIEKLQEEEDKELLESLNSEEVKNFLFKLTGRYKQLLFNDSDIIISDDYNEFSLKDLSTGAKEQVMIALRIGFLSHILKTDSAFLILDDAFQHSDYDKREILIKSLFELAMNNWQIIYLTMDDHIKDLFKEASHLSPVDFNLYSL